jgi:GNAT superfamily N-acetyltransferase
MSRVSVTIRHFREGESVSDITQLLRRSYRRLADLGLRYTATWQNDEMTLQRLKRGTAYVACVGDELVGTLTFEDQDQTTGCPWYNRPEVASFHQFAVDPGHQGLGIGRLLLERAEQAAIDCGAQEIALDTAEWAHHLIDLYFSLGYRLVEEHKWDDTNYLSVILSKDLSRNLAFPSGSDRIAEDYKKSLHIFERATVASLKRDDTSSLHAQRICTATTYFYASKFLIANFIFKQLLRDIPTHSPFRRLVHQQFGKCLAEQRQLEEAKTQFDLALKIHDDHHDNSELLKSTEKALLELGRLF